MEGDAMIVTGWVYIANQYCTPRKYDMVNDRDRPDRGEAVSGINAANLVYEAIGDRLGWHIYRFHSNPVVLDGKSYGPEWHSFGMSYDHFLHQKRRKAMSRRPSTSGVAGPWNDLDELVRKTLPRPWKEEIVPLDLEAALELFREAIDLRPPPPK